jgi:hypothetical protein
VSDGPAALPALTAALQRGLLLERRGLLLPWGASWQEVARLSGAAAERHDTATGTALALQWPDESVLGGLAVSVAAAFLLPAEPGLSVLHCRPAAAYWGDPWAGLEPELAALRAAFGLPGERRLWGGYDWHLGTVDVALLFHDLNEFHYAESFAKEIILRHRQPGA